MAANFGSQTSAGVSAWHAGLTELDSARSSARPRWELLRPDQVGVAWWAEWDRLREARMPAHPGLAGAAVNLMVRHYGTPQLRFASLQSRTGILARTVLQPLSTGRWTIFCPMQATVAPLVFDGEQRLEGDVLQQLLARLGPAAWKLDIPYQDPRVTILQQHGVAAALPTGSWQSVTIAAPHGWDDYWAGRSKELRHNVERRLRKACRDGFPLQLRRVRNPDEIGAAVDRYCDLEAAGWKGAAGTALRRDNAEGRFYRELLTAMAHRRSASVYELLAGDRVVAARLVLCSGTRHAVLKTTYDESLKPYSPGILLLHHMLRDIFSIPGHAVELCTHARPQQLQWATDAPVIRNHTVFRSAALRGAFELRRWLKDRTAAQAATPMVRLPA